MSIDISQNIAAIVTGDKQVILYSDVLLEINSVGICGSDLKYWAYGVCGRFKLDGQPMVIGHEACGTILKVGSKVGHLKTGDRVAIEPGIPCKSCEICKSGRYNLCADMRFCATPPIHGNLCQFYVHDADFCYKIPDNMSSEEGAMLEPLSVAVYTCERASIGLGHKVLIFGAGPIGILCGLVAKSQGASLVCIVDIDDERLAKSKLFNASDQTYKIDLKQKLSPINIADEINSKCFDGNSADCSLECSGADSSFHAAIHVTTNVGIKTPANIIFVQTTRSGGSIVLVGRGSKYVDIPIATIAVRELNIKGIFRYATNNYAQALSMVASGAIDVKQLITHRFDLREAQKAFETACDPHKKSIKVMLKCNK